MAPSLIQSILWEFNETISIYDYPGDNNATSLLPTEQIFNSTQLSTILTTKQPCLTNCYAASKPTVVEGNYIAELVGPVAMLAIVLSIVFVIYFRYQQRLKTQKKNDKENSKDEKLHALPFEEIVVSIGDTKTSESVPMRTIAPAD